MSLSNLPPGVNLSDIPGNRPEDEADEAFWRELDKQIDPEAMKLIDENDLVCVIELVRDMAYTAGYREGVADGRLDLYMEQHERALEAAERRAS